MFKLGGASRNVQNEATDNSTIHITCSNNIFNVYAYSYTPLCILFPVSMGWHNGYGVYWPEKLAGIIK